MNGYSEPEIWWLIIICGIITFLIRFSFFKFANDWLIAKIKEILSYLPASIFAAIVTQGIFPKGIDNLTISNHKIIASLIALSIAIKYKNVIITILSGLSILWLLNFLF